jgi:hypothetical protein
MLPNPRVARRRALAERAAETVLAKDLARLLDRTARVRHAAAEAG